MRRLARVFEDARPALFDSIQRETPAQGIS
jgi:hypothetical protein